MKCPKCGAELTANDVLSDGFVKCHSCGSVYRRKAEPVQTPASDQSQPKPVQENAPSFKRTCPHCGASIDTGLVCSLCGYDCSKPNGGLPNIPGNIVATLFKVFAVIIYLGSFFIGLVVGNKTMGSYYYSQSFSLGSTMGIWLAGFVSGTIPLGFSEIIKLLHEINVKQNWK